MSKTFRRWWLGGGLLLIGVAAFLLWPRPIRIPLSDGTTLTISAITVGTEHSRPEPISWRAFQTQPSLRSWGWPGRKVTVPNPCIMLWVDGMTMADGLNFRLIDRHGWHWFSPSMGGDNQGFHIQFHPIETDGTAQIEVFRNGGGVLGTAVIPIPTVVPVTQGVVIPTIPPVYATLGEPAELPIRRTVGPLEATLRSFELRSLAENFPPTEGRYQLETSWRGRPFAPQASVTILDRFGRRDMVFSENDGPLLITLPPRDAIWDLHFHIFRSLDVPLDPEETLLVTPVIPAAATTFQQEGSHQGGAWRLTLAPSGSLKLQWKSGFGSISFAEQHPVIVVELDTMRSCRIRIDPLDQNGNTLPTTPLDDRRLPVHGRCILCPTFDAAKGHTIRIGFEEPRTVQFTIRPKVEPKVPAP